MSNFHCCMSAVQRVLERCTAILQKNSLRCTSERAAAGPRVGPAAAAPLRALNQPTNLGGPWFILTRSTTTSSLLSPHSDPTMVRSYGYCIRARPRKSAASSLDGVVTRDTVFIHGQDQPLDGVGELMQKEDAGTKCSVKHLPSCMVPRRSHTQFCSHLPSYEPMRLRPTAIQCSLTFVKAR